MYNTEIKNKLKEICSIAYSTESTVWNTYNLAMEALHLEGCFVECGIGAGAQIMAMKLAATGSEKIIYAYDSFEGIPLAGPFDVTQPGIGKPKHNQFDPLEKRLVSSNITVHSEQNVKDNFNQFGISISNILFIKGWFQTTLNAFTPGPISLLRLDGDLYESTLVCLEKLYPLVLSGGVIIIDDYALEGCKKAMLDYFKTLPKLIEVDGGNGVVYFYKP